MKNKVRIDNEKCIVTKEFRSKIAYEKELYILTVLSQSKITPKLLESGNNYIIRQFVLGETLSQAVTYKSREEILLYLKKLLDWLVVFQSEFIKKEDRAIVLDDINLKNFIVNMDNETITGIDFEQWHYGNQFENLYSAAAMVKTSDFIDDNTKDEIFDIILNRISIITGECVSKITEKTNVIIQKTYNRRRLMKVIRKTDAVILAGGESSRMRGYPKGLLEIGQKTFIDKIVYEMQMFDKLYISANTNSYDNFGCEILCDNIKNIGPISAIQAALSKTDKEWIFICPCDMPFISAKTIMEMFDDIKSETDCALLKGKERIYPTVGIYNKRLIKNVSEQIMQRDYRLMNLLENINTVFTECSDEKQFININTPSEYDLYKKYF